MQEVTVRIDRDVERGLGRQHLHRAGDMGQVGNRDEVDAVETGVARRAAIVPGRAGGFRPPRGRQGEREAGGDGR